MGTLPTSVCMYFNSPWNQRALLLHLTFQAWAHLTPLWCNFLFGRKALLLIDLSLMQCSNSSLSCAAHIRRLLWRQRVEGGICSFTHKLKFLFIHKMRTRPVINLNVLEWFKNKKEYCPSSRDRNSNLWLIITHCDWVTDWKVWLYKWTTNSNNIFVSFQLKCNPVFPINLLLCRSSQFHNKLKIFLHFS